MLGHIRLNVHFITFSESPTVSNREEYQSDSTYTSRLQNLVFDGGHHNENTDSPVHVMIITQMRSGSSFTGELFNRNDNFVYFYEPLYDLRLNIQGSGFDARKFLQEPLRNTLKCDFKDMPVNWWSKDSRRAQHDCQYSRALQTSPLCSLKERNIALNRQDL